MPSTKTAKVARGTLTVGLEAEGDVEGPAGIGRASVGEDRDRGQHGAGQEEVPGEEVKPREGHVVGADEHGQGEVAEYGRDAWDHDEEDHYDAVHREQGVVASSVHQSHPGRKHLDSHEDPEDDGYGEEAPYQRQVEHPYALVVRRGQPGEKAPLAALRLEKRPGGLVDCLSHASSLASVGAVSCPRGRGRGRSRRSGW